MNYARLILLTGIACFVTGCAGSTLAPVPAEPCSSLVPQRMREATPSAVLKQSDDPSLDAQVFGIEQTGQLNIANRDKADQFAIITSCERRDAASLGKITAPWWAFWR